MKVLIAVSCLLAVASAGFVGHSAYSYPHMYATYAGPQHLPVIGPNGVPVDDPAVQARRAEHAAAYVEASARNGDVVIVGGHHVYDDVVAPVAYAGHAYAAHYYAGPQHLPVIGANGVPVDEPAVQVARAEHAASHIEAKVRNGDAAVVAYAGHHIAAPAVYAAHHVAAPVVAYDNGAVVPADTVEVAAAKAEHFAAHVEAKARNGVFHHYAPLVHYRKRRGVLGYAAPIAYSAPLAYATGHVYGGPQHLPVIGANGVPVDEPAVQVARAEHAASHIEAKVRNGDAAVLAYSGHHIAGPVAYSAHHVAGPVAYSGHHVAAPVAYSAHHIAGPVVHYGAQHLPVIGANGVPVDEPAVQVARAAHAAHHIEAEVRNGDAAIVAPVAYAAHHVAAPAVYAAHHIAAPAVYAAHHVATPVVAHANGAVVPADTIEVAAAKAEHYAAHIEAKVRNGDLHHVIAY